MCRMSVQLKSKRIERLTDMSITCLKWVSDKSSDIGISTGSVRSEAIPSRAVRDPHNRRLTLESFCCTEDSYGTVDGPIVRRSATDGVLLHHITSQQPLRHECVKYLPVVVGYQKRGSKQRYKTMASAKPPDSLPNTAATYQVGRRGGAGYSPRTIGSFLVKLCIATCGWS